MKILFIEPYFGGSHKAFANGWINQSRHQFDLLSLPASKWKWRMRHGAVYFAKLVKEKLKKGAAWDCIFCSEMLNLAEFIGLAGQECQKIPKIVYFHENQLTYPQRFASERDYQYVLTNFTTALAADGVWFNSDFHRREFLTGIKDFLKKMPDFQPVQEVDEIEAKSDVVYPGVELAGHPKDKTGPLRILWAARWEHDKNPEDFFEALKILKNTGADFRLNVIGEQFRDKPVVFDQAYDYFRENIDRWGYQPSKDDYLDALRQSDVVVSTAVHEFFGIGILEAISAGCVPVLPNRLSYPEILMGYENYLYDGTEQGLAERLGKLIKDPQETRLQNLTAIAQKFSWKRQSDKLDDQLEKILIA
jgi:glycosyltransferase involved in cell wall biosynthesis